MATKELEYIKQPVPKLQDTLAALKRNDIPGARDAFEAYDGSWNGIEVYISTRSRDNYTKLEMELQHQINDLLAAGEAKAFQGSNTEQQASANSALMEKYNAGLALVVTEARGG